MISLSVIPPFHLSPSSTSPWSSDLSLSFPLNSRAQPWLPHCSESSTRTCHGGAPSSLAPVATRAHPLLVRLGLHPTSPPSQLHGQPALSSSRATPPSPPSASTPSTSARAFTPPRAQPGAASPPPTSPCPDLCPHSSTSATPRLPHARQLLLSPLLTTSLFLNYLVFLLFGFLLTSSNILNRSLLSLLLSLPLHPLSL